jgi:hypothetical protein
MSVKIQASDSETSVTVNIMLVKSVEVTFKAIKTLAQE